VKQMTPTPSSSRSTGSIPAVCETSRMIGISRARHTGPISRSGCTVPITFEPWLMTTARVLLRSRPITSPGSM